MSKSSQNYKDLAIPFFREVFELIDDVLKNREITEEDDLDDRLFSARILGRKAKAYLDESEDLETRIHEVLEENTVDAEESRIAKSWAIEKGWDLEYCVSLLKEFKIGLSEGDP